MTNSERAVADMIEEGPPKKALPKPPIGFAWGTLFGALRLSAEGVDVWLDDGLTRFETVGHHLTTVGLEIATAGKALVAIYADGLEKYELPEGVTR